MYAELSLKTFIIRFISTLGQLTPGPNVELHMCRI